LKHSLRFWSAFFKKKLHPHPLRGGFFLIGYSFLSSEEGWFFLNRVKLKEIQMAKPKMALDFDNVFVASLELVGRICLEKKGIVLPPHVYRYTEWTNPLLSEEEFLEAVYHVASPVEWAEQVALMPGVLEGVRELLASGVEIDILTARGHYPGEIESVVHVLTKHALDLRIIGTAYQPKVDFLDGHVLILDDQLHEFEGMPESMHRLLFSGPHNQHVHQDLEPGIRLIHDWPHAVETIKELLRL